MEGVAEDQRGGFGKTAGGEGRPGAVSNGFTHTVIYKDTPEWVCKQLTDYRSRENSLL